MNKKNQYKIYSKNINLNVYKHISKNKKILDVGCNTGNLGEKLIKEKSCRVFGIDNSKNAVLMARKKLDKVMLFDLETYKIPFPNEKFDVIIFADVLEHVRYPEKILKKYSSMLKSNGIILASLPNVANINIRLNLFFGKWNYQDAGILDRTHMRFFTKKTIVSLFKNSGYKIIKIDSTPGFSFIFLRYFNILKKLKGLLCKVAPKLLGLQFIIIAKK